MMYVRQQLETENNPFRIKLMLRAQGLVDCYSLTREEKVTSFFINQNRRQSVH